MTDVPVELNCSSRAMYNVGNSPLHNLQTDLCYLTNPLDSISCSVQCGQKINMSSRSYFPVMEILELRSCRVSPEDTSCSSFVLFIILAVILCRSASIIVSEADCRLMRTHECFSHFRTSSRLDMFQGLLDQYRGNQRYMCWYRYTCLEYAEMPE